MEGDTIAVVADHAGFDLKETLKRGLQATGYAERDLAIEFEGGGHAVRIARIS
jgi:ribose 5-phosphate isomerase RpiB